MSLSTLPDLCLLTILDRIPLYDLLANVNLVCHRWANLYQIACHSRRQSLILVEKREQFEDIFCSYHLLHEITNDDGTPHYKPTLDYHLDYNTLINSQLSGQACEKLVTLLPNITSLRFSYHFRSWKIFTEKINFLLEKWSTNLVHLQLFTYIENDNDNESIDSLVEKINHLSSLKRRKLYLPIYSDQKLSTKLQILPQLEQFAFWDKEDTLNITRSIEDALAMPNCVLKRISLSFLEYNIGGVIQSSVNLKSRLTRYRFVLDQDNLNDLSVSHALSGLDSLKSLSIRSFFVHNLSYAYFINSLSHLSQLTFFNLEYFSEFSFADNAKLLPLPSVKAVELKFGSFFNHHHLDDLSLSHTFPNVQVISFTTNSNQCFDECDYDFTDLATIHPTIRKCSLIMLKSLKKCTKLRKIYLTKYGAVGQFTTKEVFTPDQL